METVGKLAAKGAEQFECVEAVICDAVRDKLRVTGFSPEGGTTDGPSGDGSTQASRMGSDFIIIWQRNRMATRAGEIHKEALTCGDAYMIVWLDERGRAVMHANRSFNIADVTDKAHPSGSSGPQKPGRRAINIYA